jgi:hypothetical protein
MKRKRRSSNQIKEEDSIAILRRKVPPAWVIHEYGPDYGIDCVVELFDYVDESRDVAETLGEVFYVQLKSSSVVAYSRHKVYARSNVEKSSLNEDRGQFFEIEVAKFQLETPELLTVQAMGSSIPVLLILVDVSTLRAFYVCLNDYIDKIIIPEDPSYPDKDSKLICIPTKNELGQRGDQLLGLRAYGKRAKMCGAFTKFHYQKKEIERARGLNRVAPQMEDDEVIEMIRVFVMNLLRLDIWNNHEFWQPIGWSYNEVCEVKELIESGEAKSDLGLFLKYCDEVVWHKLSNLSNMYEELVREWFLPTYLSQLASYPEMPRKE